jgi:hypothetical protein
MPGGNCASQADCCNGYMRGAGRLDDARRFVYLPSHERRGFFRRRSACRISGPWRHVDDNTSIDSL